MKRFLSLMIAVIMVISMVPTSFASEYDGVVFVNQEDVVFLNDETEASTIQTEEESDSSETSFTDVLEEVTFEEVSEETVEGEGDAATDATETTPAEDDQEITLGDLVVEIEGETEEVPADDATEETTDATVEEEEEVSGLQYVAMQLMLTGEANEAAVAKIGDATYTTLAEAVTAATAGDTIDLYASVDSVPTINKAITIKGAVDGVEINAAIAENFPNIEGTVTFENLTFNNRISTENASTDQSKMTLKFVDCTFNVPAGNTYAIQAGASWNNDVLGALVVDNCTFTTAATSFVRGYMIYAQCVQSVTVTGSTLDGNNVFRGAIHLGDSTEYATDATIENNTIQNFARGVQVGNRVAGSEITISGNTFDNVNAIDGETEAAAVYIHEVANAETTDVAITSNIVTSSVEGTPVVFSENTTGAISGFVTEFTGNTVNNESVTAGSEGVYSDTAYESDTPTVSGTITGCLVDLSDSAETFIASEINGLNATESVVIELYSGETQIATTTLLKPEYYVMDTLGVKIIITGESSSWATVWAEGMPRADMVPDKVVLYVDGQEMNSANVPMTSTNGELAVNWAEVPGVNPAPAVPAGDIQVAYTSASYINDVPAIFGEATGVVGTESFVVKLYSDEELVGTAELVDTEKVLLNGVSKTVTWHAALDVDGDSWWFTEWSGGALNVNAIPDKVELYVDGVMVSEGQVELNINDLENPICAAVTDADGNVQSFVAGTGFLNGTGANAAVYGNALQPAVNAGGNIVMLRDVESGKLTVDSGVNVTLDLNGKTLTGSIQASNAMLTVKNGSIVNKDSSVSAIEINAGTLNLNDVNIESERHAVRIDGVVEATINGGEYKVLVNNNVTSHAVNVSGGAKVSIVSGTFYGPKGTPNGAAMGGSAVNVRDTAVVNISGGNFSGGVNNTLNGANANNIVVTGGTYDQDPAAYVAEGYAVGEDDDIYTVGKAVAQIGIQGFVSLADAIAAANAGNTITVLKDIADEDATVSKAVTIDLNGMTLNDAYIIVTADVTIKNGGIVNTNESYPLVVQNGGKLTIEDVKIEASKSDRAIWVRDNSTLNFNSGSILATKGENNTKSSLITAIYTGTNTNVNINGGTITVDTPDNKAVGIYGNYENADVTLTGGKISTSGKGYNYGIHVSGDITVSGGEIVTNEKGYGYSSGIRYGFNYALVTELGNVTISGGTITTNGYSGYAVNVGRSYSANDQVVTITGGTFTNNLSEVEQNTGGHKAPALIYEGSAANVTVKISDGTFKGFSNELVKGDSTTTAVSGGAFDVMIGEAYLADSCMQETETNNDGLYAVVVDPAYGKVAQISENYYETFAEAAVAAQDGNTITLLWEEGDDPIAMNGAVYGKTVTITGTAEVDWSKGFLFIGRGGEGDGTVIFDGANLTSASNSSSYGIHVSGREKDTTDKYNGTLTIKDSTIELDYLINKGTMTLDNSTLTVKNGFSVGGRPASETEDGKDATATLTLNNGTKLTVNNHNGMGLGYEAIGVMNVNNGSTFETTQSFLVTEKGTMNVNGGTVKVTGTLTNNGTISVSGASDIAATVTGSGWVYMNSAVLDADTELYGAKVRFASGTNTVVGSTIDDGFFQVGIGAYNGVDANVDTVNGVTVNVKDAVIGSSGSTYAGWIGTGYYGTDAEKTAAMTDAKYVLNIENSVAEFGYLHVSNDGVLNVKGNAASKVKYNNSEYSFRGGDFIINGTATFDATDVLAFYTKVSCDNGTDVPGTLNIVNGTEYEVEPHNGGTTAKTLTLYKTGVVNVGDDAKLYVGDVTNIAADAVLNIGGTATAVGTVTNNGAIKLTEADATFTAAEGLTVTSGLDAYKVDYADGSYKLTACVARIDEVMYETLAEAFAAAQDGDEVIIVTAGTYELSTSGKDITITGAVDSVVFDNIGAKNMGGAKVTFNNVTFDYYPNVNYTGLQHSGDLTYNNCTFNGMVFLYGASETFNNCTFNQDSADAYNVWTYGAKKVAFNECTFNCVGKSVLVYNEGACATDLTVTDTEFIASTAVEGKAAIEIDTSLMPEGTDIVIDGETTATGFDEGSISGSTLWNDKKDQTNLTVTVANVKVWPLSATVNAVYGFKAEGEGVKYRENFQIELHDVNALESLVVKLYSNGTEVATTTLRETDRDDENVAIARPITGSKTVNVVVAGRLADSWDTEWHVAPSVDYIPDTVKVYTDGILVETYEEAFDAEDKAAYSALPGVAKDATVTDTEGNVTYYSTITAAIDAAQAGDTVTILAGEYTGDVSVNKAITVVGETDSEGNNLVTLNGKLSVTGTGVTVKNLNVNNSSERALYVSGGNILIEGCNLTGVHGLRYCYANNGDVTLKDCVITGSTYGVHFDGGSGEGNVIIDGCTITGWTSFGSAIEGVTITDTEFKDGNYDVLRFYQDATLTDCTFSPATTIDFGKNVVTAKFNDCSVSDGSAVTGVVYLGDIVEMAVQVYVDDVLVTVAASVTNGEETSYYLTLEEAVAAAAGETVTLLADATGAGVVFENGDNVTIDLNGHTYTLNESVGSSAQYGTVGFYLWAGSDVTIKNGTINMVPDEMGDDVTFFKMFHTYGDLTLTDVTLDCANGVAYNGSTDVGFIAVESDNGTLNIGGSTSIVNAELSPETWTVVAYNKGKATIDTTGTIKGVVASYGANASVEIKNGTFTEENTAYGQLTQISGGTFAVSGGSFTEAVAEEFCAEGYIPTANEDGTYGVKEGSYVARINDEQGYETLAEAFAAAKDGDTIALLADVELSELLKVNGKSFTLEGKGNSITGAGALWLESGTYTVQNVVFKNITYTTNYGILEFNNATATVTDCTFQNNTAVNCIAVDCNTNNGTSEVTVDDCTFTGNTCSSTVINLADGTVTVKDSEITGNTAGIAVIYTSTDSTVTGNYFNDNTLTGTNANKAAVVAGPWVEGTYEINITGNAFVGEAYPGVHVEDWTAEYAATTSYNLNGNYWNGEKPNYEKTGAPAVELDNYFTGYSYENSTLTLSDEKAITYVAQIGETKYETLAEALAAVQEGQTIQLMSGTISEGTVTMPATLKNVTIKGAEDKTSILKDVTLQAADGNTLVYEGLTIDGIVFDNSNIVVTGWRSGTESYKDWTITNCEFKNIVRDSANQAAVHINLEAASAIQNFTFTNNVIDGVSGGSNSGVYAQLTGNVKVENNIINNVAFRPYIIQITTDDGIADTFTVTGNTFSGSSVGRAQGLGNNVEGTDNVTITVTENIFKDITDSQQICYWNFNAETTTADLSRNYYDIDISANPSKIYYNAAAQSVADLIGYGVYPIYKALNEDGTIDEDSLFYPYVEVTYADGTVEYFEDILEAVPYKTNYDKLEGATIKLLGDYTGSGIRFVENDMVLDLNGYTYTINEGTGSNTSRTQAFQVRDTADEVIVKNGTIAIAAPEEMDQTYGSIAWMFNNYTNLMLENVVLDCTNLTWSYGESCYAIVVQTANDTVTLTGTTTITSFDVTVGGAPIYIAGGAQMTAAEGLNVETGDGYKVVYENGVYSTVAINYVAQIGETKYETLKEAMEAAKKGDVVELLADITVTDQIKITDNGVLSDITVKGNNHTITADLDQSNESVLYFGDTSTSAWATGVKINDLTIDGTARFAIALMGGTSSELTNVTVTGDYVYGINLYGTHGATMTDCDIVTVFTNAQDDNPLNLVNTKIGHLYANKSDVEEENAKVFIDETSSVERLTFWGDATVMIDPDSTERIGTINDAVAKIGGIYYKTLQAAVDAAVAGDVVTVIADIDDEAVTVDKSITIAGDKTLNNVSITGSGADVELTVSDLSFSGNSWINSGDVKALTVTGVTANVTPSNADATNSRSAFIALGKVEQNELALTIDNCEFVVSGGGDPVLGWAAITKANIIGNTFGSTGAYIENADAVKFLAIADGAVFNISGNTVYSNYNGFVFGQNTTRDNAYTVNVEDNDFYGTADHIWVEVSGATTTHATVKATSDNTVNGNAFTAADIKTSVPTWTSYAGVDVKTNEGGKLIGGTYTSYTSQDLVAEDYEAVENVDGTWTVEVARIPAATIGHGLQTIIKEENGEVVREAVTFTVEDVYARTELKVELYHGGTLLSTTTMREADLDDETVKLLPAEGDYTVNIVIRGEEAGSWDTVWHVTPTAENIPDTIKVYVDGGAEPADTYMMEGGVFLNETEKNEYIALFEDELFDIVGANMLWSNSLDMFFYVNKADLEEGKTDYYVEINRTSENGEVESLTIPYEDWEDYNTSMVRFAIPGIAAKEMTDPITVEVFSGDGIAESNVWNDSIKDYATRTAKKTTDEKSRTALVDMLNYGAAAQLYFGYREEDLANAEIADLQQYATTDIHWGENAWEDKRVQGTNYIGTTLTYESNILMTMYFENITTDMYAIVTHTNHYGSEQSVRIEGSEFYVRNETQTGVDIETLVVADGAQLVTCKVYNSAGELVAEGQDSMASYSYRMKDRNDLYTSIAKFSAGVYAYLHS